MRYKIIDILYCKKITYESPAYLETETTLHFISETGKL
jgi:hypothetical protein